MNKPSADKENKLRKEYYEKVESKIDELMALKKVLYEDNDFSGLKLENLNYKKLKAEIEERIEKIRKANKKIIDEYGSMIAKNLKM